MVAVNKMCKLRKALLFFIWISCFAAINSLPRPQQGLENNDILVNCGGELEVPLITPCKDSLKLEVDSDYTLHCEASEPIVWWHGDEGLLESETFDNAEDPNRPYGIKFHIKSAKVENVGAHYCIPQQLEPIGDNWSEIDLIELVNNEKASTIYIFVDDKSNLLAPLDPIINARQYTDLVIPCKPAMPETEVLLTFNGATFSSETTGRYDPKRGFFIVIRSVTDAGYYTCVPKTPSPDNEEESTLIDVRFIEANDRLNKPLITSSSRGHVYEGETFELVCEVYSPYNVNYKLSWSLPDKVNPSRTNRTGPYFDKSNKNVTHQLAHSTLTVRDAKLEDKGVYKCTIKGDYGAPEFSSYKMVVMKPNSTYLKVREPSYHYTVQEYANRSIQMNAVFEGFPAPTFKWYKPNGIEVWETEPNFKILSTESSTTLKVINAQLENSGTYILKGTNGIDSKQLEFNVSVISGPVLSMEDVYVVEGQEAHLNCTVQSYPTAVVTFLFKPCSLKPRWPSCSLATQNFSSETIQELYQYRTSSRPGTLSVEFIHEAIFTPKEPGIILCVAQNLINNSPVTKQKSAHVMLGDIAQNMTIDGLNTNHNIAKGDEETFTCSALAYHFDGNLEWFLNGEPITEGPGITMETSYTTYSYKSTLKFSAISDEDRGTYMCRARNINPPDNYESREINVYVHDPKAPQWEYTNLNPKSKIERNLGDTLELQCRSKAMPPATVKWYKDEVLVQTTNHTHILEDGKTLRIPHLYPKDDGIYRCVVNNRLGSIENSATVIIANLPGVSKLWIWMLAIFFTVLIALCAFLAIRYRQERKRHLALKAAGLANFEEGAVEHINPALSLDEQAELLPYDRGFEFPRDKLKLGKQLGAGAFGVVLKGEAQGIRNDEAVSIVAVKMVKRTADAEVVRALVSELKIMVHLGQHLNVVNLLGAVTKNIAKRELMVIVEYCRFGNIQNFLLRNRKCFINQINPMNDRIDATIMTQRISDSFDLHRNSDNDPRSGTRAGRTTSGGGSTTYDRQLDTCATEATVMTTVPEDDHHVMSNNSIQPAWRSNYKTDSTEAMTVTTTDLVSWAFQVARGMDYLSSKKVLHGDLAARNILLCEDNVVKICDFGLARSMYRGDNYKKSESGKLPIKWLALESLSDHVFSTYSDVWSFGIVLWELFSLSKVPYPGIDPNQELFNKLNDGYRMEKPPYANQELYEIMLECWRKSPESRPLFNVLEKRFANMLGEDAANHYLDLNDPYMRSNTEYLRNHPTDYLSLMGSPDEFAPAAPRYVNGHIVPDINTQHGQHSPTLANNMESSAIHKSLRRKNGMPTVDAADQAPEEIPMLHRISSSDDGDRSPEQQRKFPQFTGPTPSPRHHVETTLNGDSENYVNVKPPRKNLVNKTSAAASSTTDAFSNPSYQPLTAVNAEKTERRY